MAVFTPVTDDAARDMLAAYDLGSLVELRPIAQGVENTNYHIFTTQGRYILTLFEGRTDVTALPFFFHYTDHLRAAGVMCPVVLPDRTGQTLQTVSGKPAALISFLNGRGVEVGEITPDIAGQVGDTLGRMHVAAGTFTEGRANTVSLPYWRLIADKCAAQADTVAPDLSEILMREIELLAAKWDVFQTLPSGVVHADLFPDNVFIDDARRVCGVIDFYFSANDVFIYDLAIAINAWCFDERHQYMPDRAAAMITAYQAQRPLTGFEAGWLNFALRAAAVRFLVSRLHDTLFHPAGALVTPKDPIEYLAKLQFHQGAGI